MNSKYLYLSIDIVSFLLPFSVSFQSKAPFYKKWKYLGIALLISVPFFCVWDSLFTHLGIWGFNPQYLCGIFIGNLPLEEILFFICIPYACVFTYFALNHLIEKDYLFPHQELISSALIILLLIFGIFHMDKLYTGVTFVLVSLFLAYLMLKIRPRYMGRFYFAFIVVLLPFFLINGVLTGWLLHTPVVWYNEKQLLGIRLGTIPFEDFLYGMLLVLMNIAIMEWFEDRDYYRSKFGAKK